MKKEISEQHRELAIQYFEAYPGEHVLHIADDGNVFLQKNHNDAHNHQRRIAEGKPLTTVRREDLGDYAPKFDYDSLSPEEKEVYDKTVKEIEEEEKKKAEAAAAEESSAETEEEASEQTEESATKEDTAEATTEEADQTEEPAPTPEPVAEEKKSEKKSSIKKTSSAKK